MISNLFNEIDDVIRNSIETEVNMFPHIEIIVKEYTRIFIENMKIDMKNSNYDENDDESMKITTEVTITKGINDNDYETINNNFIKYIPFKAHETCYSKRDPQQKDDYYMTLTFNNAAVHMQMRRRRRTNRLFFEQIENGLTLVFENILLKLEE